VIDVNVRTRYAGECSSVADEASDIQGSGLGPASYVVTAADLHPSPPENNLKLNCSKSKEIIFSTKGKRGKTAHSPSPYLDIKSVNSLRVLSVIINDQLTATDHMSNISLLVSCNSFLYAA